MKDRIWLSSPHMGGAEQKYIKDAFDNNWVAPLGPNVDGFEMDIENYLNGVHVAVLSSGTAAIHLALILLGVKQDDEILVSSFTFSATVNPIVYLKAKPVFIDSEKDTWNIDPELLEFAIKDRIKKGTKPKAIIIVHLYGMPAKIDQIMQIADNYNIPVIEDAAEALGSSYNGRKLGTFGKFGILSFNGNKIITTSGGGALVSSDPDDIEKARFLATQARDKAPHYQHTQIGYNYRMSNIVAGIGRGQMEVLDIRVDLRRENNRYYRNILENCKGISFLKEPAPSYFSNFWLTTIIINPTLTKTSREKVRLALEEENIESRPLWKPMHLQPVFSEYPKYTNNCSEELFNDGLCLPSGSNLSLTDKLRIKTVLEKQFNL